MSEVKRFRADHRHVVETEFDDAQFVSVADFDRVTAERDALQQRLTAAGKELEAMRDARVDSKLAQPQGDTVPVSARWTDWSMVTLEIDGQHRTYVECGKKAEQPAPVAVSPTCCGSCPGGCVIGVKP